MLKSSNSTKHRQNTVVIKMYSLLEDLSISFLYVRYQEFRHFQGRSKTLKSDSLCPPLNQEFEKHGKKSNP